MWGKFHLKTDELIEFEKLITDCDEYIEDETEFGFGFRKQLVDEINDVAFSVKYDSRSESMYVALPDVASAIISRVRPDSLTFYSNAKFISDERVKSKIEEKGREQAVMVVSIFWKIARFMRSPSFWKLTSERAKALEIQDKIFNLLALLGDKIDRQQRLVEKNAH